MPGMHAGVVDGAREADTDTDADRDRDTVILKPRVGETDGDNARDDDMLADLVREIETDAVLLLLFEREADTDCDARDTLTERVAEPDARVAVTDTERVREREVDGDSVCDGDCAMHNAKNSRDSIGSRRVCRAMAPSLDAAKKCVRAGRWDASVGVLPREKT